ncbi:potassium-transporting ATPase subunit KdpC [Solibacillus cecembensis]|uniref:potassium-transporting ATPase subunit KdpC n=1 Tax=Solibacillus cecembensis TaxID=459347 RepID=UPI003D033A7B
MKRFFESSKQALLLTLTMFIICGVIYPFAVTGVAQAFFKYEANGSLLEVDGKVVGSELLGQSFTSPQYFWGRVSAVNYNVYSQEDTMPGENGEIAYGGVSSGTFNYAPSNPELITRIESNIETFLQDNPGVKREQIPADLMTASGSGLDPHISVNAALIQMERIAKASGLSVNEVEAIVKVNTEDRLFGIFGENTVNVLSANIDIYKKMNAQ